MPFLIECRLATRAETAPHHIRRRFSYGQRSLLAKPTMSCTRSARVLLRNLNKPNGLSEAESNLQRSLVAPAQRLCR
jgi:hypothetical protein